MYFMLSIRFTGEEGDEVPVMDLLPQMEKLIVDSCNVKLHPTELYILGNDNLRCIYEGRRRAPRN
jgi:F0F1-type ATP synthase beta subunit